MPAEALEGRLLMARDLYVDIGAAVHLAAGQETQVLDFGNVQLGEIRGTKFNDRNGDGIRQANEPGLAGWTLYLDLDRDGTLDANEPTALTNADGVYQFTDLPLGDYVVEEVAQAGWRQTSPVNNSAWGVRAQWLDPAEGTYRTVAVQLDPATGAVLRQIPLPGEPGWWGDVAFNGSSLFYRKDQASTELYEIDPATGAILDMDDVSTGGVGLAVIGQYVYLQTSMGFDVFDSETDTIVRSINVLAANDYSLYVYGSLTALRGPEQLIGFDVQNDRFVVLDPETGVVLRSFGQAPVEMWGSPVPPGGLAVQGERIYAYFNVDFQTVVDCYGLDGSYLGRRTAPQDPDNPDTYTWAVSSDDIGAAVHLAAGQETQVLDFGNVQLGVTINQAANQVDPTRSTSILFEVVFSESVTGFTASDVVLSGTAGASTVEVVESGPMDGTSYLVFVTGMAQQGTVVATIPAGAASDVAGLGSAASTSTDNSVYFDVLPNVSSFRVNDGAAQRSMVKTLTVTFTEPVTLGSALTLRLHSGASVANVTISITNPSGDGMTYVAAFSGSAVIGGSLPDGIYDLVLNGSAVTDATGNAVADTRIWTFHRLFGDSDGNKTVDALDCARLKNTFARASSDPLFNSAFDYEGNSLISGQDLARFRQRYGLVYSY